MYNVDLCLFRSPERSLFTYELPVHILDSPLKACDGVSGAKSRRGRRDAITPRLGNKTVAESILYLH